MAESAASFLFNQLNILLQQLLGGIGKNAMYIRDELGQMKGLIRAAGAREESNDQLEEWVKRVRKISEYANFTNYGFEVSWITHRYKVIYLFQKSAIKIRQFESSEYYKCEFYEYLVYTLGTGSWRRIPRNYPFEQAHLSFGVFLNGNLHGLVPINYSESDKLISCFDLEDESFEPFSPPPSLLQIVWFGICNVLGVLDGCSCICDSTCSTNDGTIVFWTRNSVI